MAGIDRDGGGNAFEDCLALMDGVVWDWEWDVGLMAKLRRGY